MHSSKGRGSDLALDLGGEEFGILLPETNIKGAQVIAAHIHQLLLDAKIEHTTSLVEPHLTISIGIAMRMKKHLTCLCCGLIKCFIKPNSKEEIVHAILTRSS